MLEESEAKKGRHCKGVAKWTPCKLFVGDDGILLDSPAEKRPKNGKKRSAEIFEAKIGLEKLAELMI